MELWSKYQMEKYDRLTLTKEDENGKSVGFILYNVYPDRSVLVDTLFVEKESRNKGIGKALEAILIEKEKPLIIYCEIDGMSNDARISLDQMMDQGYKLDSITNNVALLFRELK